ncbi:MAG: AI-2E family transporter, partial [Thermodesulfobacteriota bacterium]
MGEPNAAGGETPPEIQEADKRLRRFAEDLRAVRVGIAVLATLGVLALLYFGASVFITLFSSALLAFALEPIVGFLCRRTGMRRQYAGGIVVFLFIALLYGLLYLAYLGVGSFLEDIPGIAERIRSAPLVQSLSEKARETREILEEAGRRISLSPSPARERALPGPSAQDGDSIAGFLLQGLGSLTGVVFSLSFIPFLVYFILADREPLNRRTRELFSPAHRDTV